ncbi:MAG: YqjK-like family protein [Sulfuricella sp.]|nr:YqjK-like family protein [Sulfuricella sp.]
MNARQRLDELYRQRADLVARSVAQRAGLSRACHPWRLPLALADQGVVAWRFAHRHPVLLIGVGSIFALTRPRRTLKWFQRGWALWRVYRSMAAGMER